MEIEAIDKKAMWKELEKACKDETKKDKGKRKLKKPTNLDSKQKEAQQKIDDYMNAVFEKHQQFWDLLESSGFSDYIPFSWVDV